jgi:integrase
MASAWITLRRTKDGGKRYRVEFRQGGREAPTRYGGSFKTKAEARERKKWIAGELAAKRPPDIRFAEPDRALTFSLAAKAWLATRIDVAGATTIRNQLEVKRIEPHLGARLVDQLEPAEVVEMIFAFVRDEYRRATIRKTLQTLAMVLDHAGISPNPARDSSVRLPRAEPEEVQPPSAAEVEAVYRRIPAKHRRPLLWLDWSGARVGSVDDVLVGDYDEPRRRIRLRAATTKTRRALWVELPPELAEAIEATLPHRRFRNLETRLFAESGSDALRTSIAKACKAEGIPLWSPHDLRHRRISLLHLRGVPWARIGEFVGQRSLSVTADTYSHVLIDETEVDYEELLSRA